MSSRCCLDRWPRRDERGVHQNGLTHRILSRGRERPSQYPETVGVIRPTLARPSIGALVSITVVATEGAGEGAWKGVQDERVVTKSGAGGRAPVRSCKRTQWEKPDVPLWPQRKEARPRTSRSLSDVPPARRTRSPQARLRTAFPPQLLSKKTTRTTDRPRVCRCREHRRLQSRVPRKGR